MERVEPQVDPEGTRLGVDAWFVGPDDENSITFYAQAMTASEVEAHWKRDLDVFGQEVVAVDVLGPHSFCYEGDDVFHGRHGVDCVAAFDGLAIIARSANTKPGRGSLAHAKTLLGAGVEYWESIRD